MSHLDILLPFGLPPAEMANDLLRACKTPALAMLLARARSPRTERFDGFSRSLPHETWLARQFGLDSGMHTGGSPPLACAAMQNLGLPVGDGFWFMLNPVHLHIARDHLVLTDARQLDLTEVESRRLFDTARALFEEERKTLVYGDAQTWFLRADDWQGLQTATPDAACGHNIDIWMPKGSAERAWRKLQNEVQMHWHIHPVNDERAVHDATPVNSVWLWGGSAVGIQPAPAKALETFNLTGWMAACNQFSKHSVQDASLAKIIAVQPAHGLTVLDAMTAPALSGDWSAWLQHLHQLESEWFAPLLAVLQSGELEQMRLILSHNTALAEFSVTRHSLRKFWAKPSLKKLLA